MTNKEKTFSALNSSFLNTQDMKINESYLNESLALLLDNVQPLYNAMMYSKRKPHSVAWEAFIHLANERLEYEEYPRKYSCTSEHLKKWLAEYGRGYTSIAETVSYIEESRKEFNN